MRTPHPIALSLGIVIVAIAAIVFAFPPPGLNKTTLPTPGVMLAASTPVTEVLPFASLSGDKNQDFLSDGLTEEIASELIGRGLLPRQSCGLRIFIPGQAGRKTAAADYVVAGSVINDGEQVRVAAWLVTRDGRGVLWAEHYDRRLTDIFVVQHDIGAAIADAIAAVLEPDGRTAKQAADEARRLCSRCC